jgi:hypothetical protein
MRHFCVNLAIEDDGKQMGQSVNLLQWAGAKPRCLRSEAGLVARDEQQYGIDIVGQTLAFRRRVARHAERSASHGIDSASSVVNFKEVLPKGALKRHERR